MMFTATYGQLSPIIPYVITAPFYFAGRIQLGVMTQTAQAFGQVQSALSFFIDNYATVAELRAAGIPIFPSLESFYQNKTAELVIISAPIHLHAPLGAEKVPVQLDTFAARTFAFTRQIHHDRDVLLHFQQGLAQLAVLNELLDLQIARFRAQLKHAAENYLWVPRMSRDEPLGVGLVR